MLLIMASSFWGLALIWSIPGTHPESLIRTKDTSTTKEITRISGALCQELRGGRGQYIFSVISQGHVFPCSRVWVWVHRILCSCFQAPRFLSTSSTSRCPVCGRPASLLTDCSESVLQRQLSCTDAPGMSSCLGPSFVNIAVSLLWDVFLQISYF